jgi:hypothetical protein
MAKVGPDKDVFGQDDAYAEDRTPVQQKYGLDRLGRGMYNALKKMGGRKVGAPYGKGGIGSDATAEPADDEKAAPKKKSPLYDNPRSP